MFYKLPTLRDKHVLVVEDEWVIAAHFADILRQAGARVIGPAASVAEACDLLARTRVDCAVLDLDLQGKRSYPVADALRDAGIPFIFATACEAHEIASAYADIPCLLKPFENKALISALCQ